MIFAKILYFPVPLAAGVLFAMQDSSSIIPQQGPEWLMGAVAGIWLVVWLLDKFGKLPNGGPDRRRGPKFSEGDRHAISEILTRSNQLSLRFEQESKRWKHLHGLLTFRSDDDGIERWLKHHQVTGESRMLLEKLVAMTDEIKALRIDEQRKTGVLVSTLEAQQRALVNIQKQLDRMNRA